MSSLNFTVISSCSTASATASLAMVRASSGVLPPMFFPPMVVPSGNTPSGVSLTWEDELSSSSW